MTWKDRIKKELRLERLVLKVFKGAITWTDQVKARQTHVFMRGKRRVLTIPHKTKMKCYRLINHWFRLRSLNKPCMQSIGGEIGKSRFSVVDSRLIKMIRSMSSHSRIHGQPTVKESLNPDNMVLIKVDLRNAFGSVHSSSIATVLLKWAKRELGELLAVGNQKHKLVFQRTQTMVFLVDHVDEIAEVLCYKNFLPIGFPTSPLVFNTVMTKVDQRIRGLVEYVIRNFREVYCLSYARTVDSNLIPYGPDYHRYVDDLSIVCHRNHAWMAKIVHHILESEGYTVNKSKSRTVPSRSGWNTLGLTPLVETYFAPKKLRRKLRHLVWRGKTLGDTAAVITAQGIVNSIPRPEYRHYLCTRYGIPPTNDPPSGVVIAPI